MDKLAKQTYTKENIEVNIKTSKSEGKNIVWKEAVREWQRKWDRGAKGRHLYAIQNQVDTLRNWGGNMREEMGMTRLRIGHSN